MQVSIDTQKRFLIHVAGVFRRAQKVHREPEHTLVVRANQLLESVLVAGLSSPN
jgi:hypothetical protein